MCEHGFGGGEGAGCAPAVLGGASVFALPTDTRWVPTTGLCRDDGARHRRALTALQAPWGALCFLDSSQCCAFHIALLQMRPRHIEIKYVKVTEPGYQLTGQWT